MKRIASKGFKQLPSKTALTNLDATQRTINDYAKLSPIKPDAETTEMQGVMRTLAKGRLR